MSLTRKDAARRIRERTKLPFSETTLISWGEPGAKCHWTGKREAAVVRSIHGQGRGRSRSAEYGEKQIDAIIAIMIRARRRITSGAFVANVKAAEEVKQHGITLAMLRQWCSTCLYLPKGKLDSEWGIELDDRNRYTVVKAVRRADLKLAVMEFVRRAGVAQDPAWIPGGDRFSELGYSFREWALKRPQACLGNRPAKSRRIRRGDGYEQRQWFKRDADAVQADFDAAEIGNGLPTISKMANLLVVKPATIVAMSRRKVLTPTPDTRLDTLGRRRKMNTFADDPKSVNAVRTTAAVKSGRNTKGQWKKGRSGTTVNTEASANHAPVAVPAPARVSPDTQAPPKSRGLGGRPPSDDWKEFLAWHDTQKRGKPTLKPAAALRLHIKTLPDKWRPTDAKALRRMLHKRRQKRK